MAHDIALQGVRLLLFYAREAARRGDYEYARRLVEHAWRIVEKLDVPTPRSLRRGVCERCGVPLIPGVTARFRLEPRGRRGSRLSVTCLICGWVWRLPYGVSKGEGGPQEAEGDRAAGAGGRDHREERAE
ncbi:ribonuclease P protein component 4 [Pyrolobus fumarii]|uniref:ribonuclease P protein component 4 n=1 Tax=Pyrolobus fumarii TaxID=54252 RepID=UPI001FCAE3E1|nr:ribonuclease P Rpr2/Rpp21/SNM1 subunit [Pyrolobus fumarii]